MHWFLQLAAILCGQIVHPQYPELLTLCRAGLAWVVSIHHAHYIAGLVALGAAGAVSAGVRVASDEKEWHV